MARQYSIIVFGASGFTGKKVLAELLQSSADVTLGPFAAAGRSRATLQGIVDKLQANTRCGVLANVDINDYSSVMHMCKQCKLVISCVGPYRLYGEVVVRACVEAGKHYLDVCGEPEFIERMEFKYGAQAAAAGCYMASACGFDSVPGDWGTVQVQRAFKPPAVPSSVEMYLTMVPGPAGYKIHYATWQSAVLGLGSVSSLRKMRAEIKAAGKAPNAHLIGPKLRVAPGLDYCNHPAVRAWHLPFPGADISVVRRTQAALTAIGQPAVHCAARFTLATRYYAYVAVLVGGLMALLARSAMGRALLLRMPSLFSYGLVSHEGPTEEQMAGTKTVTTLICKGYTAGPSEGSTRRPDREVVMQIVAPDAGYAATSIYITQAALAVLEEPSRLPSPGVHTPGMLLKDTSYAARLQSRGITVTTLSDTAA